MTRVYVDMVADLFHYGHVEFLRYAHELGDELIVGILSDEAVRSYKRLPVLAMDERMRVVAACRYVDRVVGDVPLIVTEDWIQRYGIDFVVHGDDFPEDELRIYYAAAQRLGILRTVPYTRTISTTNIVDRICRRFCESQL